MRLPEIRLVEILALFFISIFLIAPVHSGNNNTVMIQNYGSISYKNDFSAEIVFEYGAETGSLSIWDIAGPSGGGDTSGSFTKIVNNPVRTGKYSVETYQKSPPKSESQRRVLLREYLDDYAIKDIYFSWWVCFPDDDAWTTTDPNGWGYNMGGIRWAVIADTWYYSGINFYIHETGYVQARYSNYFSQNDDVWGTPSPMFYIKNHLNEWIHFQCHLKLTSDYTGVAQAWINDDLFLDVKGIKTDPLSFSGIKDVVYVENAPCVVASLYGSDLGVECWYWADDLVASRAKVPENYAVLGQ